MSEEVHGPADLLAGVFFASIGAFSLYISKDYTLGSATSMGPGYFPAMVGWGLVILGLSIAARGLYSLGLNRRIAAIDPIDWRGTFAVLAALVAFALSIRTLGLAVAIASISIFSHLSTRHSKANQSVSTFLAIILFSYLVFIKLLSMNINMMM